MTVSVGRKDRQLPFTLEAVAPCPPCPANGFLFMESASSVDLSFTSNPASPCRPAGRGSWAA